MKPTRRAADPKAGVQSLQQFEVLRNERRFEDEILGRIAWDRELGRKDQIHTLACEPLVSAMILSKFPRKSPTVELIWAKPIFMLATQVMRATVSSNRFREL